MYLDSRRGMGKEEEKKTIESTHKKKIKIYVCENFFKWSEGGRDREVVELTNYKKNR